MARKYVQPNKKKKNRVAAPVRTSLPADPLPTASSQTTIAYSSTAAKAASVPAPVLDMANYSSLRRELVRLMILSVLTFAIMIGLWLIFR